MSHAGRSSSMVVMFALALAAFAALNVPASAQQASGPYTEDWSTHHVIFSNPGPEKRALENGTYSEWLKTTNHDRYVMQERRRHHSVWRGGNNDSSPFKRDWSMKTGAESLKTLNLTVSCTGTCSVSSNSTMTIDGQTFTASAPAPGTLTGTFHSEPTGGGTLTIVDTTTGDTTVLTANSTPTSGTATISLTANPQNGDTITIGAGGNYGSGQTIFCFGSSACSGQYNSGQIVNNPSLPTTAVNLAFVINNAGITGISATPSGDIVTVSNANTNPVTLSANDSDNSITVGSASIAGTAGSCTSQSGNTISGYFLDNTLSTSTLATYLVDAINSCNASYSNATGVTVASSGSTITFTGPTGTQSPGITFTDALGSAFTMSGTTMPAGTNGTDSANAFKYTQSNGTTDTADQLAQDLYTAVTLNTSLVGIVSAYYPSGGHDYFVLTNLTSSSVAVSENRFTDLSVGTGSIAASTVQTVLPTTYPAKYGFYDTTGTTPACYTSATNVGDWVVYPTGAAGSSTNASVIAYDNLYKTTCSGPNPGILYAYDTTGSGTGAAGLSPIISKDGSQVAYIQVSPGGGASLVLLKWAPALAADATSVECTASNGSAGLTSCTGITPSSAIVGAPITQTSSGSNVPSGTYVSSYTGTTITMSANAANLGTGTGTITFNSTPYSSDFVTIGSAKFCFTNNCSNSGNPAYTVTGFTNASTAASALASAIGTHIASTSAASSAAVVTLTYTGTSTLAFSASSSYRFTTSVSPIRPATASVTVTISAPTQAAPYEPTLATSALNYHGCTAPCYYAIAFKNSNSDSYSSPFYTYNGVINDYLYVGDDNGYLHRFSSVFDGNPAETTTGNWPVSVSSSGALTSPVYDDGTSQLVFVTDSSGYLYSVVATVPGTPKKSARLDCGTGGFIDGPLVDSYTNKLYVFAGEGCSSNDSAVIQFSTTTDLNTQNSGAGVAESLGNASTNDAGTAQALGTFDNIYYSSSSGTTGNLYACVNGAVYQIPMSAGFNSAVNTYATLASSTGDEAQCSPLTEYYNTSKDYLFLSLPQGGSASGCASGCVYNFDITTPGTSGTPKDAMPSAGGTGGIVVDNSGTAAGESQIYYSTLFSQTCKGQNDTGPVGAGTGTCAVQASQSGLQ